MNKISAVIITYNEEDNIKRCLSSIHGVVDEIIVVDSGSTDKTEEICSKFNVKFIPHDWEGFGKQKNFAVNQSSHDWILSIDADEELTPALGKEIKQVYSQKEAVYTAYSLPRTLVYLGRKFKYGTENKQYITRLFNKKHGGFTDASLHEKVQIQGKIGMLKCEMLHYSYMNIAQHLTKINTYSSIVASVYSSKKKTKNKWFICLEMAIKFISYYFINRNILNGFEGFTWSIMGAYYKFIRNYKLAEKNCQ
ncbi:MAG: glycosyltransferase family 2 protein [Bacteroidales bacterium]